MSELPGGWATAKVGEVFEITYGKDFRKKNISGTGSHAVYGANGVIGFHDVFTHSAPQLIVGCRGSVGNARMTVPESYITHNCLVLQNSTLLDKGFLKFAIDSRDLSETITGTSQPQITIENLKKLDLSIAPFNEQRRIVVKLESLLGSAGAAQARLATVPRILKRFRQSVLAAACSGRLTADWRAENPITESAIQLLKRIAKTRIEFFDGECQKATRLGNRRPRRPFNLEPVARSNESAQELPESWFWLSFEDAASSASYSMSSGPFGSALGRKDYRQSGIPVIRGQNVQVGKFVLGTFVYISEEKALELERSTAFPRDIIVVAVGSSGQSAMIPNDLPIAVLSQNCNKITLDETVVLPEFVNLSLQIEGSLAQLQDKTTDTARPFLSLTNLKTLLLPIAPLAEQQEIVRRVEALFKTADALETRYRTAKAHVDKLRQSILAKAFRGELVPQDPNDEPASVLMERIKVVNPLNNHKPRRTKDGKAL